MSKLEQNIDYTAIVNHIKTEGLKLGFQQVGIANIELSQYADKLTTWIERGWHGEMSYMQRHQHKRCNPKELVPGTITAIVTRMNYLPEETNIATNLADTNKAYIARYALGRDYHKVIRKRLQQLADTIQKLLPNFNYRAFTDSAPVLEKPLAEKAGLGWIGKNTLLLNDKAGSWFFLGVIYTNLPLPVDKQIVNQCGNCQACISICPTQAFVKPYQLDARRCISYLTIENRASIPEQFRSDIGNRVFGCDDCQLVCPWNRYAQHSHEQDFSPRHQLASSDLVDLFNWDEATFLSKTAGSAIRRAGYHGWLRNIAIGLGNAPNSPRIIAALTARKQHPSALVREHVAWALERQHAQIVKPKPHQGLISITEKNHCY